MTDTSTGTEWAVISIARYKNGTRRGDGDTLDIYRARLAQLGDDWFHIADAHPNNESRTVPIRLAWVDTPERGDPRYHDAIADLTRWIETAGRPLTVICYGTAGWDRILADLRDANGNSASAWLMTHGNNGAGWPLYEKGK